MRSLERCSSYEGGNYESLVNQRSGTTKGVHRLQLDSLCVVVPSPKYERAF